MGGVSIERLSVSAEVKLNTENRQLLLLNAWNFRFIRIHAFYIRQCDEEFSK